MSQTVYFLLCANPLARSASAAPELVALLECHAADLRVGTNGLYLRGGDLQLRAVWHEGRRHGVEDSPPFEFRSFSATQRTASRTFAAWLCKRFAGCLAQALACEPTRARIMPSVVALPSAGRTAFHHFVQQGELGSLFVHYRDEPGVAAMDDAWCALQRALHDHGAQLDVLRPALGDECWYTKWRPDLEMERKFTFAGVPDTWTLLHALHAAIADGQLAHFVPELDREIQVWDYEQHIFEVLGANAESGYIAYIPQADGLMTIKRKWFIENSEVRRESLFGGQALGMDDIETHVRTLTDAPTRRLPSYRRKRFDAQFESLATGNIFGIYMDVCRTLDDGAVFSQCEVEYCRSRTFGAIRHMEADFDGVSGFVGESLQRWGVAHQQDLYSKLDFVRAVADGQWRPRNQDAQ